jgi:3'-phosphoadenosine 5'-phosphosulfate sulfotransferase (PAPS reductase)/FAD synthetase
MAERIAFHFSGGKDSTAALYFLQDKWDDMTVYWLNSGDVFPEVRDFIYEIAKEVPHFIEVTGRVHANIRQNGIPADIVPFDASDFAAGSGVSSPVRIQNKGMCCLRSIVEPLHHRMKRDSINVVLRGQRKEDKYKGPLKNGEWFDGIQFLYPIDDWSNDQVYTFLKKHNRMPPLYRHGISESGDCMTCSAWLGDGRAKYLALHHPAEAAILAARMGKIAQAVILPIQHLTKARRDANEEIPPDDAGSIRPIHGSAIDADERPDPL